MSSHAARMPDIVIPAGQQFSNIIPANLVYADAIAILIQSPAVLDATTFIIYVSANLDADDPSDFVPLQDGNPLADVGAPAAGKAQTYFNLPPAGAFMIVAGANVAADRTFVACKQFSDRL